MAPLTPHYHNNGDPGFADNGRDLNRFRCEFSAYQNLSAHGVCEKGVVPRYYGHVDQLDPGIQTASRPFHPRPLPPQSDDLSIPAER